MAQLQFKPTQVTKKLILQLPDRARDVIIKRYGLADDAKTMTLESIGNQYGITRERVRQIENHALNKIRQSDLIGEYKNAFEELQATMDSFGGIIAEEELLAALAPKKQLQNHIYLLLTIGDAFTRERENGEFKDRWHTNRQVAGAVHEALEKLHGSFSENDLVPEDQIIRQFVEHLDMSRTPDKYAGDAETLRRWLNISKTVGSNPLGEWGLTSSPNVRVKGMRDYAYLVIRQHGSPMHFTEVTKKIRDLFGKRAHVATTHNELIKDPRFVLVGRGLYALTEWGYMQGVVKDVIAQVLEKYGPATKEEIIERVLKERYVKSNTILVNLQDMGRFKKSDEGLYMLAS